jgi:hypothetical protein
MTTPEPEPEATEADIQDEESGADDPELKDLDQVTPEVDDTDEDVSSEVDESTDDTAEDENYDPANDGDDAILAEVAKEEIPGGSSS